MGKFEIYKGKDAQFYFRLKAGNGEIIGGSEGYKLKSSAKKGIESVRKNAIHEKNYDLKETKNEKWRFNLKARNGQTILSSQMYSTESGAKGGISSVTNNAPNATIHDDTIA